MKKSKVFYVCRSESYNIGNSVQNDMIKIFFLWVVIVLLIFTIKQSKNELFN